MSVTIKVRRDTAANWTSANPTLAAGEPGYETDTKKLKFGDGSTAWTSLSYFPPAGSTQLVYKYTVTGSDKASIDTGVDTPDAGSNDWTNGDLLEIWWYSRTDQAVVVGDSLFTFNNDTGSTQYVWQRLRANDTSVAAATTGSGAANIDIWSQGANALANAFTIARITVPNYAGTVGFKAFEVTNAIGDSTAANDNWLSYGGTYRSTSAITRLKVANTSTNKFKVGSQILIYKRLAS